MEQRGPHEILGVSRDAPRPMVDNEYRRRVLREHRLLDYDADAIRRLHELNEAYAAIVRPKLDRNGYALVFILAGAMLVGWLLDIERRVFVYAPVIIGLAGFFWLVDTLHRRISTPQKPAPTVTSVVDEATRLLGGRLERESAVTHVAPPQSGAYLAEPLYVGDSENPAALLPAGLQLPFEETFVLSAADGERSMLIPIAAGGTALESVRVHALRPMNGDDLLEVRIAVQTDGRIAITARDAYTESTLRAEAPVSLVAPVAIAGYRA